MPGQTLSIGSLQYLSELVDCKEKQTREMVISHAVLRDIAACRVSQCDRKISATRNYHVLQGLELDCLSTIYGRLMRLLGAIHP
jgi:hypothetical protein